MSRLLMISGDRAIARGRRGAFYNTLEEFHKHWERIDVVTPSIGMSVSQVLFGNVYIHSSPWPLILQPLYILKKGLQLHRKQTFDVMTVHEYPPFYNGIGAWLLHRKIGIPYLLEIMHIAGYPKAGNVKELIYRFLTKALIRFDAKPATKIRVINRTQTPRFLISGGVPENKIVYIPAFYIDLEVFTLRDITKDIDYLFVARLVDNKGVFLFLDAVRQLSGRAYIVGEGPARARIEKYIEKYQLQNRIQLHGWAANSQEIAHVMNRSRILIMPSYNEGGPRVVLEAMACGVPVIATPVGIVHDVIVHGESGYVVGWNAHDIKEGIDKLLSNPEYYQRLRDQGLVIASQFERVKSIQAYAEGIRSLL